MNNLIERLREESLYSAKCTLEIMDLCMEAASELEEEIKCRKKQADIIEELRGQKHEMISRIDQLKYELEQAKMERDAAIKDMCHIAEEIERCDVSLDETGDKVNCLKLGRCDVCKHGCHEGNGCNFEWRGLENEQ